MKQMKAKITRAKKKRKKRKQRIRKDFQVKYQYCFCNAKLTLPYNDTVATIDARKI